MTETEALCLLVSARGLSYGRRDKALHEAGSALAILEDPYAYRAMLGDEGVVSVRAAVRDMNRILDGVYGAGVSLLAPGTPGWSVRLSETQNPPHLLFCMGKADISDAFPVAVVGTRRASSYGLRHAREIARDLAKAGVTIVSGLATGIDAAGHEGALEADGRTIAVLGGALDRFFPEENRRLMERMLERGGSVVSEYPMGMGPTRYSFLLRNRIIAGLSLGVFVAEGARRSGAGRTASDALEAGREVFALPGNIDSENAQLPNLLIAEGAHLVTSARDILGTLVIEPKQDEAPAKKKHTAKQEKSVEKHTPAKELPQEKTTDAPTPELDENGMSVYRALLDGEKDFDFLCAKTEIPGDELGALLMEMEMDGVIESLPGLYYRLSR